MVVLKFGGTSVGSAERLKSLTALVSREDKVVVVLSAMSGVTNLLELIVEKANSFNLEKANLHLQEVEDKFLDTIKDLFSGSFLEKAAEIVGSRIALIEKDISSSKCDQKLILAQGELITTEIFSLYLNSIDVENHLLMATDFMILDENKEPDELKIQECIKPLMSNDFKLFITQGFIASTISGEIDNLKRGGSDYSASLIAAALDAKAIEIWTDIDGFHNNDPRFVDDTKPLEYLSFDEAAELAYFGAKILHPASVIPARNKSIKVWLKNTMEPEAHGTLVSDNYVSPGIKAVAAKDGITTIRIQSGRMLQAHGFLKKVFEVFDKYKTPIDVITTSEVAVSLTIDDKKYLHDIVEDLMTFGRVKVINNCSIVSVVGNHITSSPRAITKTYEAFETVPIHMISFGGSSNNITFVIDTENKIRSLRLLNNKIFQESNYV
ncbi:MAG: aspartate kinase [Flavobacteriales bacterium]|nr:aspartate kinase [Flavobacteriales bacterium]